MEVSGMCDFSLETVTSRPARIGDRLTTRDFGTGTRGFAAPENPTMAVCVLPGTELVFSKNVIVTRFFRWSLRTMGHSTATFRQVNKDRLDMYHDAVEFPDGHIVLLTKLHEGQEATVLQLPAQSKDAAQEEAQKGIA
jgi:hypothetical protein